MLPPSRQFAPPARWERLSQGFTLTEVMVVVVIIAILAAIGYPSYLDYTRRSHATAATEGLGEARHALEQFFLSNRTYSGGPCGNGATLQSFALTCSLSASSYTVTATGSGRANGFVYTMDHHGTPHTTSLPTDWGTVPSGGHACWVVRKGETC